MCKHILVVQRIVKECLETSKTKDTVEDMSLVNTIMQNIDV